jgi:signal peptidase II
MQAQPQATTPITEAPSGMGPAGPLERLLLPFLLASVVLATDQLTKALVRARLAEGEAWPSRDAWLAISHVENSGAAFGTFQGAGVWLLGATVIGVGAILVYLWRFPPPQRLHMAALSLILGGAFGNLIDRVTKGTVTDFIDPAYYPAFNVADSAVVVGVGTMVILTLLEGRRR